MGLPKSTKVEIHRDLADFVKEHRATASDFVVALHSASGTSDVGVRGSKATSFPEEDPSVYVKVVPDSDMGSLTQRPTVRFSNVVNCSQFLCPVPAYTGSSFD